MYRRLSQLYQRYNYKLTILKGLLIVLGAFSFAYSQEIHLKDSILLPLSHPSYEGMHLHFLTDSEFVAIYPYNDIMTFYKTTNNKISVVDYSGKPIFSNYIIKGIVKYQSNIWLFNGRSIIELDDSFQIQKIIRWKYPYAASISFYNGKIALLGSKYSKPYEDIVLLDGLKQKPQFKIPVDHTFSLSLINGYFLFPSINISILNDSLMSMNYVFAPINYLFHIPRKKFTYFIINPLEENKERKFFIDGKRWGGVPGMIKNTCLATHYMPLKPFTYQDKIYYFQCVFFPIAVNEVLDENSRQEHLKQKVSIWESNFQFLGTIEVKQNEFFLSLNENMLYTYKKNDKHLVILRYKLQIF